MKIMLGTVAGAASGSMGNLTVSRNRGGYYIRMRVIPTKVMNQYTVAVQDAMATCSRAWGALTAGQQMAWNTWANANPVVDVLGQKQALFGNAAYCMLNTRLIQAGNAAIAVPPVIAAPEALLTLSAVAAAGAETCVLTFTATPLAANHQLWVQAALLVNPGVNYFKNLLKLVKVSAAAQATDLDIGPELTARFGIWAEGHRLVIKAAVFDDETGLLSGPRLATATVAA